MDSYNVNTQKIAEWLHKEFCCWNHTDGCSWLYEEDDWNGWAHKKYLEKARRLLNENSLASLF
jgi:hypothetical protein